MNNLTSFEKDLALVEKLAAGKAVIGALRAYGAGVHDVILQKFALTYQDALSGNLSYRSPRELTDHVHNLRSALHNAIRFAADNIENRKYDPLMEAVKDDDYTAFHRQQATTLLRADKDKALSLQSVTMTIAVAGQVNKCVIKEIEKATGDGRRETRLLFTNALLVYEIASFALEQLGSATVGGVGEIEDLHRQIVGKLDYAHARLQADKKALASLPASKATARERIRLEQMEASIPVAKEEWEEYFSSIVDAQSLLANFKQQHLPTLRYWRQAAETQVVFLDALAMIQVVKGMMDALAGMMPALEELELVPLTAERVRRLIRCV